MKRTIKVLALALLVLAVLSPAVVFSGGAKDGGPAASSGGPRSYPLPVDQLKLGIGKYNPPIEMTTVGQQTSAMSFRDKETVEDNIHTQWALDRFGIKLKYLWSTSTANNVFITRMRLALASGEPMPDVVAIDNIALATDMIDSGKFQAVGDLWEDLASPLYRKAVAEDPSMWYPYTKPDGVYGLPVPELSLNDDTILYVRQDWLDKFKLQPPKTLAEMEKIMDIFVNQDPDGNGQKDTVGLAVNLLYGMRSSQASACFVFGAYGDIPGQWNKTPNGSALSYGSIQPSVKQGLATLNDWWKKGYIHREAGIHNQDKANELFTSGKAGFIASPAWADRAPLNDLLRNVPGADFYGYRIPAGPSGKAGRISNRNYRGAVLVRKGFTHPEAIMLYYNYLWENFSELKAGTEFAYGWKEGYDYIMVDGKPSTNGSLFPKDKPRVIAQKYTITWEAARSPTCSPDAVQKAIDDLDYIWAGNPPRNGQEIKNAGFYDKRRYIGQRTNLESADLSRQDYFGGAPTPTQKTKGDYLNTDELETFLKIITGAQPVDEFDRFVARWKSNGGDQITKEVNDWYNVATGKK